MRRDVARQVLYPDSVTDSEIVIPSKKPRDENAEWRLQAKCVKLLRAAMKLDGDLRFIAPGAESLRDGKSANIAKMMGRAERGIPDLLLLRRQGLGRMKVAAVEFKRPGGKLTPEQRDWFAWMPCACHRVDSMEQFKTILAGF